MMRYPNPNKQTLEVEEDLNPNESILEVEVDKEAVAPQEPERLRDELSRSVASMLV